MFFVFQPVQDREPDIDRLISEYSKCLTKLCYLILKDVHLAEEAAWDTLYKAYSGYNGFRKESSEKTWITQIAINICKSYMRKSSYREISCSEYISLVYISEDQLMVEFKSEESLELLIVTKEYNFPIFYWKVIHSI